MHRFASPSGSTAQKQREKPKKTTIKKKEGKRTPEKELQKNWRNDLQINDSKNNWRKDERKNQQTDKWTNWRYQTDRLRDIFTYGVRREMGR